MIESKPGKEDFAIEIDTKAEEIAIYRCGKVYLRARLSRDTWARLGSAGLTISGRARREAEKG